MNHKKRVIIVGGGFGGLSAAKALGGSEAEVVLIDRSNHHLFQPLLYQVATAALSPADIAAPTRALLARYTNVSVLMDEVTGLDAAGKKIKTANCGSMSFDYLVLATGAEYSFFGNDHWRAHAPTLKSLEDALRIRSRLLEAFERAEREQDPVEIRRLLTFVVVGGGPTGVEMAGAIAELAKTALKRDFRRVGAGDLRIILIEAAGGVLSAFPQELSEYSAQALRAHGVEVMLQTKVSGIDKEGILTDGGRIRSANVVWAAGIQARPAAQWLKADAARNKAVRVYADCSVPGHPDIYAIGDVSSFEPTPECPLPGIAPVAKQQGRYVGKAIRARIAGRGYPAAFRYYNWGSMAVIGRSSAVADFGWLRLKGWNAWLAWSMVHLLLLIDFRSKVSVYVNWAWSWFTHRRGARLLTSPTSSDVAATFEGETKEVNA
ncbi:NAD(P)/FAD-dependent oxidoreductase [Rhizobium sp. CCGE 510]|uniref:NAD(P)/FAD-dependent oxidoreductase n=1 Tax=Rhizobium sp. CCGE 510 TaxID=1132836 RepID=UPI00027B7EAA|nr:NAD(P)/FAD-dependent oxidoreductase [Rhizobium sp. CCGE 510]EJT04432.1 FAD-dependent pyridine nucleotide-disulfide oxidoreductase [Rhizobium sp. CCGE 510]